MRVLVTGWFGLPDGEATAGDVLALAAVRAALDDAGLPYDVAWSPVYRPGALTLAAARPKDYTHLVFVCGPLHGAGIGELHCRFAHCRRIAVGVSVIDAADPAVAGFHQVLARDGDGPPAVDLAAAAQPSAAVPVAGVILTQGQGEYGDLRRHEEVTERLTGWLGGLDCARLPLDTRLDGRDWRLCATAGQFAAVLGRLDVVVTTRLHGLVLALCHGVPALAVDPVAGGGKVTAQARALGWPAVLGADQARPEALDPWWRWCLSGSGRTAAARGVAAPYGQLGRLVAELGTAGSPGSHVSHGPKG